MWDMETFGAITQIPIITTIEIIILFINHIKYINAIMLIILNI